MYNCELLNGTFRKIIRFDDASAWTDFDGLIFFFRLIHYIVCCLDVQ